MGSVLSESVSLLQANAHRVFENLLAVDPNPVRQQIRQWDDRGYVQDMNSLPQDTRNVFLAMMNVSTLSSEGLMSDDMWSVILPLALSALSAVQKVRRSGPAWSHIIHPVDARILLSERLYELVVDDLNRFGEELGDGQCAVIALLSALRSSAYDLFSSSRNASCWQTYVLPTFAEQVVTFEEDRDLAGLLTHMPVPFAALDSVIAIMMNRIAAPVVRVFYCSSLLRNDGVDRRATDILALP